MTVERTANEIIVRIPNSVSIEEIKKFLNYLRYKEIIATSKATQVEIDELAVSVNKGWWAKNKQKFLPNE
jgi:hypothetical protein